MYLKSFILSIAIGLITLGCGYHFSATIPIVFPNNAKTIIIQKVINPSQESWLEGEIRSFLNEEITKRSNAKIISQNTADLSLTVRIEHISTSEQTKEENDLTFKYAAKVSLSLIFKNSKGVVVLKTKPTTYSESYTSEAEKKEALAKAVDECLRLGLNQLSNNDF